jgi:GYF domain 2
MANEWFYAENGESFGPLSGDQMLERIGQCGDEPLYVWREGMAGWTEAREAPEFGPRLAAKNARPAMFLQAARQAIAKGRQSLARRELAQRARHELIAYLAVSGYLLVWFSAVLFYKSTVLRSVGIEFAPFALAAVKALILGKFILVLEAFKIGDRDRRSNLLIVDILKKALLFTLVLFALTVLEEVVVGHFHGKNAAEALSEIGGGSALQALAGAILMFLALLPYLAFRRLALVFGDLPELLFTLNAPEKLTAEAQNGKD